MMTTIKKKGSLELSVNAIVVLVLAITMLGLGIAFTKGKFAELGSKVEIPEPDYPATTDDPIVLPANEITVSSTKDTIFTVNVYNDGDIASDDPFFPDIKCKCPGVQPDFDATAQSVPIGEDRGFKIVSSGGTSGDKCLCTIRVEHPDTKVIVATKQITVNVK